MNSERSVEIREAILERDGCPLHYWLAGPEDRPLVVFTHGVMMDHRIFAEQVPAIAPHYRVLVWDVRGHGLSRPWGPKFTIRQVAADLAAILDQIHVQKVILVGHSMGGYISQEFAFRYPDRVAAMAVIGSSCWTWKQPPVVRLIKYVFPAFFRISPYPLTRWLTGRAAGIKPHTRAVARQVSEILTRKDRICFWSAITNGYHYEPGYRFAKPLLLTHGRHDRLVGFGLIPVFTRAWVRREPCARYVIIPDAGHNAHQDNPDVANRLLLDFLKEQESSQSST